MSRETFEGRIIEVLSIDDALSGEHIIEFVDPAQCADGAVLAIYNKEETWRGARISINPQAGDVRADFMRWAIEVSRKKMGFAL